MDNKGMVVWCISKYGSPARYGMASKSYKLMKYLYDHGVVGVLISSDSNHLASYPHTDKNYVIDEEDGFVHLWFKVLKYRKSASLKRLVSWIDFEVKLLSFDFRVLQKPDVIVVSSLSLLTILSGIVLKHRFQSKLIFEVRDIYPLTLIEEFGVSKWNPLVQILGLIERIGYKRSDLIVGTMPNLSEHVQETIGHRRDVFYSPLGIPEVWTRTARKNPEIDEIFPKTNRLIIGYAGSMSRTNALNLLVDVIKESDKNDDFHFVLVGEGDLKGEILSGLSGCSNVTVGPRIDQEDIPYFLSKCDLLYLSTHESEVWRFGQSMNKLVDYMMSGKPVVASYSGFPSMLNEAKSGVFISDRTVEAVLGAFRHYAAMSSSERIDIGSNGRRWMVDNCSSDAIGRLYLDRIYKLLVENP